MARTDITTTKLARDADIADIAGTTVDATLVTNGVRVLCRKPNRTFLRVSNTHGSTHILTVAGSANAQVATDYATTAIPATTGVRVVGPLSGRFIQSDGGIYLNLDTGHTGVIQAYELP